MRIDPKQLERMARQMGLKAEGIDAEEVIIRKADGDIIISEPQVTKVNMMGQETFQIVGTIREAPRSRFAPEDVRLVMEKTGATEENALNALEEEGDIAAAILKLKKK